MGLRVCAFYALTGRPLRGSTAGLFYTAPPGLKFRLPSSLLRSYAEVGACARKLSYTPFNFRFIGIPARNAGRELQRGGFLHNKLDTGGVSMV